MDLALNLGTSLQEIKEWPEEEFERWAIYADKYILPKRRVELQLATLCMWVARSAGAEDITVHDFLFDPPTAIDEEDAFKNDAEALGFNPQ